MLVGFYSGVSGIYYNEQKLDAVAHNMANVDTTGFRRSLMMFRTREENPHTKWMDPKARERFPSFYGVERKGVYKNFEPGRVQHTGNPMDMAINEEMRNAFFAVRRPDSNETFYTRNGSLSFGPENPADPASPTVLYIGGHIALGEGGAPIPVNPQEGDLTINQQGMLMQGTQQTGAIPLYRMNKSPDPTLQVDSDLQSFMQMGDSLFKIPPNRAEEFNPMMIQPEENRVLVLQGSREKSNVNSINELMEMMGSTKGAEANMTAISTHAEALSKLFQTMRT